MTDQKFDPHLTFGREWFAVIVFHEDGPLYEHQCGCVSCRQRTARGILYPLPFSHKPSDTLCHAMHFGCVDYEYERIQQVLESGRGLVQNFEPDPDTYDFAQEAFVPVRVREDTMVMRDWMAGRKAALIWDNCD